MYPGNQDRVYPQPPGPAPPAYSQPMYPQQPGQPVYQTYNHSPYGTPQYQPAGQPPPQIIYVVQEEKPKKNNGLSEGAATGAGICAGCLACYALQEIICCLI